MTKLGPCRVFTPKQRRAIANEFARGTTVEELVDRADFAMLFDDAVLAVEDAIRWAINSGWRSQKENNR